MMLTLASVAWWIGACIVLVVLVYPLVSFLRSRIRPRLVAERTDDPSPVSMILVGHNEAPHVRTRIEGLLREADRMPGSELIVITGGATDGMDRELMTFADDPRVRLVIKKERVTKVNGVNEAVGLARHDLLFFCDWRQPFAPGTVERLIQHVRLPHVGTATASLTDDAGGTSRSWTRRVISAVNRWDSHGGGCLNVHGACYAQKRSCFRAFPSDIIFDDLFVVASTHAQGLGIVQVEGAAIHDVRFDRYYGRERVLRLTRGLLLFLVNHGRLILHMGFGKAIRFLIFKYGKLAVPLGFLLMIPQLAVQMVWAWNAFAWPLLLLAAVLLVPRSRRWCITMGRFLWFTLVAELSFFLLARRSTQWEKLKAR